MNYEIYMSFQFSVFSFQFFKTLTKRNDYNTTT
jgi:hypothetical protein